MWECGERALFCFLLLLLLLLFAVTCWRCWAERIRNKKRGGTLFLLCYVDTLSLLLIFNLILICAVCVVVIVWSQLNSSTMCV
jgi:hypothetical protein